MANKETFVVRTSVSRTRAGGVAWHTTIAHGRPEAVRQLERIGPIDPLDKADVRSFLEGGMRDGGEAMTVSSWEFGENKSARMLGMGIIFKVDE